MLQLIPAALIATAALASPPGTPSQEPVVCDKVNNLPNQDRFKRTLNLLRDIQYCKSPAAELSKKFVEKLQSVSERMVGGPSKAWCRDGMPAREERDSLVAAAREVIQESKEFYEYKGRHDDQSMYSEVLGAYHGEYRAQLMQATGLGEEFSTWFDFEFAWKGVDRRKLPKKDLHKELHDRGLPVPPTPCRDAYWAMWQLSRELQLLNCQIENAVLELNAPAKNESGGGCTSESAAAQEPRGQAERPAEAPKRRDPRASDITGIH